MSTLLRRRLSDAQETVTLFTERWRHLKTNDQGYGQWKRYEDFEPCPDHSQVVCDECSLPLGQQEWGA